MSSKPSPWWRRLLALAELAGDIDQHEIATRLGVSDAAVSDWKIAGKEPRPDVLRKAAKAYSKFVNEDTDELFKQLKDIAYPLDPDHPEGRRKNGPKDHSPAAKVYQGEGVERMLRLLTNG